MKSLQESEIKYEMNLNWQCINLGCRIKETVKV